IEVCTPLPVKSDGELLLTSFNSLHTSLQRFTEGSVMIKAMEDIPSYRLGGLQDLLINSLDTFAASGSLDNSFTPDTNGLAVMAVARNSLLFVLDKLDSKVNSIHSALYTQQILAASVVQCHPGRLREITPVSSVGGRSD